MATRRLVVTRSARRDLADIESWVARQSGERQAADVSRRLRDVALLLVERPRAGSARPSWGRDVRVMSASSWLLLYHPLHDGARILRVLHGARDVPAALGVEPLPTKPDESA